jgi:hypothetical protein
MEPTRKRKMLAVALTVALGCLNGCHAESNKQENRKALVQYWTHTGNEHCVTLVGVPYCFLKKDIQTASFPTDSRAGFLFTAPANDPDLVKCAEPWYAVDWENIPYPNIHMTVSELKSGAYDVHSDGRAHNHKYWHVFDIEMGIDDTEIGGPSHFVAPKQRIPYFGEQCLKLNSNDLRNREALCYGGNLDKGEPAYFWGCDAEGSEPNPACMSNFYLRNLEYGVTSSRKCAPFMSNKLIRFAISFVEQGRVRAQNLSTKPKRPIE